MTKKKKLITIIVSVAVAVLLITSLIIGLVINSKREKAATTVMTCSVNPQIQFVLNAKNEVMQVIALNNDGQAVAMEVDFIGLDAEDAAEMFVTISTKAGFIDVNTTGTAVNFDLNGSKKNYDKLEEKIKKQVNEYFDENGIIAGAVTTITEDFKEAIKTLKPNALNIDNKSQEELMEHYQNIVEMIDGIAPEKLESWYNSYNELIDTLNAKKADLNAQIAEYESQIADYKTQLESITDATLREIAEEGIATAERIISNIKQGIIDAENEYYRAYNDIHSSLLSLSEKIYQNIKADMDNKLDTYASKLIERRTYFQANKSEVESAIADFRATLNA